ncbi:rhodanese-like domain-containing protein [Oceaniovalibus sp. ACAM 378]|uniref:rhodanese-like domain-containing protein n=1 Tax=Oceaniovalibus sp. ACAM 378 TaxID=2599923 RepID=UPI0011D962E0|nr:rhodanese-like domain-containing protein [Oceaniovalibus sp. ACAM 378]TYB89149.1 rhodanese-like domain-containing protein [Oceaniovalibus sp. ACAM 378]
MPITPVADMVKAAKAEITTLSVADARAQIDAGTALLVDIRDPRELDREGRVPDAFHAPRGMLEFWVDPASPYHKEALATEKTLILMCAGAARSALSAQTLQTMGMTNVAELEGGFKGWKEAGAPLKTADK